MSRSKKQNVIKDHGKNQKLRYHRKIRRVIKHCIKNIHTEDYSLPNFKEIINDYDYCDYVFMYHGDDKIIPK